MRWLYLKQPTLFFTITDEDEKFSITNPGYWSSRGGEETIHKLRNLLELRSQNDIELHKQEIRKRANQTKIGDKTIKISDLDTSKNEKLDELKNKEWNDLEEMVFRMELPYSEIKNTWCEIYCYNT